MKWPGNTDSCFKANIFGGWDKPDTLADGAKDQYLTWDTFRGPRHLLKRLVMKIRPIDFEQTSEIQCII